MINNNIAETSTMSTFSYIIDEATAASNSWSNVQIVKFHYFNPNGLYAKWRAMTKTISDFVDAGVIPSGWLLAYGSFSDYSANHLAELNDYKRINGTKLSVVLESLRDDIERGYNKLAEELTK